MLEILLPVRKKLFRNILDNPILRTVFREEVT